MYLGEISAIGAALCWSCAGLISVGPARSMGPIAFNRLRMFLTSLMLLVMVCYTGGLSTITLSSALWLTFSSVFGIFLGDTVLFITISRLGPRRTGILFACNAPITALLGYLFLAENLSLASSFGCLITITGVMIAVYFGNTKTSNHSWEDIRGGLSVGVAYGLLAAFLQAIGSIVAKPALDAGVDPLAAATFRTAIATFLLAGTLLSKREIFHSKVQITPAIITRTGLSGLVGMALGMTFLLYGLANGPVGIVATLSSLAPVLTLPLIWLFTRKCPQPGAWCGAIIAVFGAALIFYV